MRIALGCLLLAPVAFLTYPLVRDEIARFILRHRDKGDR